MRDPRRPLIFMHVAKSAGTSINTGLLEALRPRLPVTGFDRVMFGGFDGFDSLDAHARRAVCTDPTSLPPDADLVHGHFSLSTTLSAFPDGQFMTVLREPRVRLLSLWRYWRAQTLDTMQGWGSWTDVVALSHAPLPVFLANGAAACQTDNMVARMLLWPNPLIPDDDFIKPRDDAVLAEAAYRRLDRFDHLDVVENPSLAANLRNWLGRDFGGWRLNETRLDDQDPLTTCDVSDRALDLLDMRSRLDRQLWQRILLMRMPGQDIDRIRERTFIKAVARHAWRMSPTPGRNN